MQADASCPHCLNKTVTQCKWLTRIECSRYSVAQGVLVNPATTFKIPRPPPLGRLAAAHGQTLFGHPSPVVLLLIDTHVGSHKGSLCKPFRAGIPPTRLPPDFVGPFWTRTIADAPHHPPPGRRSSHPIRARRDAFRRHHSAPGIQPCGDHFDTGLRPAPAPFARALPATPAGSYSQ